MKNEKARNGISLAQFPIIHPHRILSYIWDEVGIEISPSEIESYWKHARGHKEPWAIHHPASSCHVPIGLHGDSARLWTQYQFEKVTGVFLNIVPFRPRSVRHSRFLVFSCPTAMLLKNRTLNSVWRRLAWSFEACYHGVNPEVGVGGVPLTGNDLSRAGSPLTRSGQAFALAELRGDWEWHRDTWRPTASWQSNVICFKCPAVARGDTPYLYYNYGEQCRWLQEEFGLEQFIARRLKENNLCALVCTTYFQSSFYTGYLFTIVVLLGASTLIPSAS